MARNDWHYISILIIFPLLIGLIVFRDYGVSTDEEHLHRYSDYSLHAYQDIFNLNPNLDLGKGNFRYYGPSFLMGANIFTRLIVKLSKQHSSIRCVAPCIFSFISTLRNRVIFLGKALV